VLAGLVAVAMSPALPALAGSWSAPVQLPGSCGSAVAVNQAGAMAAGGTFTAADGTTHVQVCTSPDGKTWQAADLGPGGNAPHTGQHPVVAVGPGGRVVAVWGYDPCVTCTPVVQAAVRPAGGSWGAPVTLSTFLSILTTSGGMAIGTDGAGNVIAAWVESNPLDVHYAVLPAGSGSWGPDKAISDQNTEGPAHNLSLAVSPDGSAVVAFGGGLDATWAASGTIAGGFSAPVFVGVGDGSSYSRKAAPKIAVDDAGQASLVWSVPNPSRTDAATRSPAGTWSSPTELAGQISSPVATAIDGAGNAIAVFGSSYAWHLAGESWGPVMPLPSGSSGGLVVADPAGTFVYADSSGNAFTFAAGATSFGTGTGSRGSLADLKIVPGQAVMLAANAVSAETVS
jgi:hypothetical protein